MTTIEYIKDQKKVAETSIKDVCTNFERETGFEIKDIGMIIVQPREGFKAGRKIVDIKLKIEID